MSKEIIYCSECNAVFENNQEYQDWSWFDCEVCGATYVKDEDGLWRMIE